MHLSQVELIGAITKNIARQAKAQGEKEPGVIPRQFNAIIEAANKIVDAFAVDFTTAPAGEGVWAWANSDEVGMSSKAMCRHLTTAQGKPFKHLGIGLGEETAHPHDPEDLGRCIALLNAEPSLREFIPKMAELSPVWAALVSRWEELEALYVEERPTGQAPKCYALMRELIEGEEPTP